MVTKLHCIQAYWHILPLDSLKHFYPRIMANISISSYGFHTPVGGYGICNNGWIKYLTRAGVDVRVHPRHAPRPGSNEWSLLDDEEREIFSKPFVKYDIGISGTTPWEFKENESPIKVAMTMAESDRISTHWAQACNGMTHVIVPNEFFKDVFRSSGVTVPISVIRSGIDFEKIHPIDRPQRDIYTFGICGYLNERKGVFDVIQAFASEFAPDERVRLCMHTTNHFFRYYKNYTDPRISISYQYKTYQDMLAYYASLDAFVFPSKAEGIGYPPREAMATGLPTIVTSYSGLAELCASYCYPLNVRELVKRTDMLDQPGNWANIEIRELMYFMRYVYEHRVSSIRKGKTAAIIMRKMYDYEVLVPKLLTLLGGLHG